MNAFTQDASRPSQLATVMGVVARVLVVVFATIAWHVGVANWRLRGSVFDLALWLAPVIALLGGWLADRLRRSAASLAPRDRARPLRLVAAWALLCAAAAIPWWRTITSPLLRPAGAVILLSCSGWWIAELAGSWRDRRWRPSWRLACSVVWALAATECVVSRGLDGDGRGMIAWVWSSSSDAMGASPSFAKPADSSSRLLRGLCDFPSYRGVDRNGVAALNIDWLGPSLREGDQQAVGPRLLWRSPVGAGWSGYVVAGRLAVTQQQLDDGEWLTAQDAASGELMWKTRVGESFSSAGGAGPRTTPTIAGDRVLAMSATGQLTCSR